MGHERRAKDENSDAAAASAASNSAAASSAEPGRFVPILKMILAIKNNGRPFSSSMFMRRRMASLRLEEMSLMPLLMLLLFVLLFESEEEASEPVTEIEPFIFVLLVSRKNVFSFLFHLN